MLEEGSRVLRQANELFASTLDERSVLERLPQMIVPALADWCTVDLLNEDGTLQRVRTVRDGKEARVIIRDSGRGIRADVLPHLFEQFHQATVADRAKHHGLGLGLAIVRHVVDAHGGRVEAHSAGEGKGAEFIVTLPVFEEPAGAS